MAIKTFLIKITNSIRNIFVKAFTVLKRLFTSSFFKAIGSFFKAIPSKFTFIPRLFKKLFTYTPFTWIRNIAEPVWLSILKYLSLALTYSISLLGKLHLGRVKGALESLQIFFQPEQITGLSFNSKFITSVRVSHSFKGSVVDHMAISSVKKPDQMTWELIAFARKEKLEGTTLCTCLPTSTATIRQIPIPIDNIKKVNRIIKYQMEPYVPFPIDDMVIDFLPSGTGNKVLTAGMENQILSEHIDILSQAEMAPHTVSLDDIALLMLFQHASGLDTTFANAVIHFTDKQRTIMVIKNNRLMFIRVLAPNSDKRKLLADSFKLFYLEHPDETLNQILITGFPDVDENLGKDLQTILEKPVTIWRPFDQLNHTLGDLEPDTQAHLSIPLGLALGNLNAKDKTFNLRKDAFAIQPFASLKKFFLYTAYAFGILLLLLTISTYLKLSVYKSKNIHLQNEMQSLFVKSFPDAKPIKGKELELMKQKMDAEARYKVLDSMESGNTVLYNLLELTDLFSQFENLIIHQLSIDGKEIKLYGSASSFEIVDRLKQALEAKNTYQSIKLLDTKKDKKDNTIRFTMDLEKL